MGSRRGFTLIELMIAIALIAIAFGVAVCTYSQLGGLQRQIEYQDSLRQSTTQLEELRATNFEDLPPITATIQGDKVQLNQPFIEADSIEVFQAGTATPMTGWKYDADSSQIKFDKPQAGRKVVINYRFLTTVRDTGLFADSSARVSLGTMGGVKLQRVFVAEGDTLKPITDYRVARDSLQLPTSAAGRLVVLDYVDPVLSNRVWGSFVDAQFARTSKITSTKLLEVKELRRGGAQMSLSLFKEARQ